MIPYSNPIKVICLAILFFHSYLLDIVQATNMRICHQISEPLFLHTLSGYGEYDHYETLESFVDADNHIIILCSYGFWVNDEPKRNTLLYVSDRGTWLKGEVPAWQGMINNGKFEAYTKSDSLEIYGLTSDMKLTAQPIKTIKMDTNKKVFKHENYRLLEKLLPLGGHPDNLFIVGHYRESRLINPVNFISFLTSGGHWGFVERPFGAVVKQDRITGYYNTPEKLETNECSNIIDFVAGGNRVHCVGIRNLEYGYEPDRVQYSYFDLSKKQWSMPVELFKEYKKTEEINQFLSPPSLAHYGENVYCTWSWRVFDTPRDSSNWPIRINESGVYFCSGMNEVWGKPVKMADLGIQPKVIVDRNGAVYVFWIEENKGLFCKCKTDGDWSGTRLVVKDVMIRTKETGTSGPPTQPFGVVVDQNNDLHIVYIRDSSGTFGKEGFKPEELVYVKLTHPQK